MIRLARPIPPPEPIEYPEDVAILRAVLNVAGFDASDEDIYWAWRGHSRAHIDTHSGWRDPRGAPAGQVVFVLRQRLKDATPGAAGGRADG